MGVTPVPKHGAESSNNKALSKKLKGKGCRQICWSPVSQEHPEREENYDDMPQCGYVPKHPFKDEGQTAQLSQEEDCLKRVNCSRIV
jgi:hypothetical protein